MQIDQAMTYMSEQPLNYLFFYVTFLPAWAYLISGSGEYFLSINRFSAPVLENLFFKHKLRFKFLFIWTYTSALSSPHLSTDLVGSLMKLTLLSVLFLFFIIALVLGVQLSLLRHDPIGTTLQLIFWLVVYTATYLGCLFSGLILKREAQRIAAVLEA